MKIEALLFVFLLGLAALMFGEGMAEATKSGFSDSLQEVIKLNRPKDGIPDYKMIYSAAYKAEGDPVEAFNEAERYAAELGICRDFSIYLNNLLASPKKESAFLESGYEKYRLEELESHAVYSNLTAKEVVEARASEESRAITAPSLWINERFLEKYGTDMASFVPSAPYGGVCLLTVSKDACGYPGQRYSGDEEAENFLLNHVKKSISISLSRTLEENNLYLTGNPDTASIFLEIDLDFAPGDTYSGPVNYDYSGYVIVFTLKAIDAVTHKPIASIGVKGLREYSIKITKENSIKHMVWTDFPHFTKDRFGKETKEYARFMQTLVKHSAAEIKRENTIPGPYSALPELLKTQAEKSKDPWEKAIYESGPRQIRAQNGELSFRVRSYYPDLSGISGLEDDPVAYLTAVSENAMRYDHLITVPLDKGKIGSKAEKAILAGIKKAASASKKAYSDKTLLAKLKAVYFPAPAGKIQGADKIAAAAAEMPASAFFYPYKDPVAAAVRFYRVKQISMNTKDGPLKLSLSVTGLSKKAQTLLLPISDLAGGGFGESYLPLLDE